MAEHYHGTESYQKIEAILERRRMDARAALEEKRRQVFSRCPELEALETERAKSGLEYNRQLLNGTLSVQEAEARIQARAEALDLQYAALLASLDLPPDYLTLSPVCAVCGDTGYVRDSEDVPARCICYRQLLIDLVYANSNIGAALAGQTWPNAASAGLSRPGAASAGQTEPNAAGFASFQEALFSDAADPKKYGQAASPLENIRKIRDSARRFVASFRDAPNENLYFFGPAGTGKTFMAVCIAAELMQNGVTVLYQSAPALFNTITEYRTRAFHDSDQTDIVYRAILESGLLIIDDLGTESMTNARYAEFITLLNERLGDTPGKTAKSTIISTNLGLKELRTLYDERIFSRIIGNFRSIPFYGEDLRLKLAATRR